MKLIKSLTAMSLAVILSMGCLADTPIPFSKHDDEVFIGYKDSMAQYIKIGADMNGFVDSVTNPKDDNPVPSDAKYTNGFYVQGAQVRVDSEKPVGLRFVIVNNTDMLSLMNEAGLSNIVYGALVQYNESEPLTFKNAVRVLAKNIFKTSEQLNADYQKFTVCVTDIPNDYLRCDITVRPFLSYIDLLGETQTLFGEQYSTNIYSAAFFARKIGNETNEVNQFLYDNIISPCNDSEDRVFAPNDFPVTNEFIAGWRNKTDVRIDEIKSTPNMIIPSGVTVYYVSNSGSDSNDGKSPASAWKSLNKVSTAELSKGDFVLFERGGYFRGQLKAQSGVTYSAYGEGEKPIICGSTEDGANKVKWKNVGGNVWEYQTVFWTDVGSMVFNHGENHAIKWLVYKNADGILQEYRTKTIWNGVTTLNEDLHFWHDLSKGKIYLYSEVNPGERFDSIEFLIRNHAITGSGCTDLHYDNLTVKYSGAHGISGGSKNLKVTNCTFEWIGGGLQYVSYTGAAPRPVRFGNGVEVYGSCNGFIVDNCYFSQIYDAAVTHQYNFDVGSTDMTAKNQLNIAYTNNVMERCVYSIEFFLGRVPNGNQSYMDSVLYENNLMWYAGEGLGAQRPDPTTPAHIKGWGHHNYVKNFVIKDNFLAYSKSMLIHANFYKRISTDPIGVKLIGNVIIGEYGQDFGMFGYATHDIKTNYLYGMDDYLKDLSNSNKYYFIYK